MPHLGFLSVVLTIAMLGAASTAHAQKRVALVIGNSAYQHTSKLTNPKNDAADMAAALKAHGFQVIEGFDLDRVAFERKVRDFSAALKGADAGLFFYAGHGLQVGGQNYLVPIDARAEGEDALDWEMLKVDVVHRAMERSTNTNILFLDACRDNPLARNLSRSMGTRSSSVGTGLASIESGVGTLISFSTQPGNVALDGTGRNSPFAGALVKELSSSRDDLSAILITVRNHVMKETQRKQVPWEHSALTGRFYFAKAVAPQSTLITDAERWITLREAAASDKFTPDDMKRVEEIARKKNLPLPAFSIRQVDWRIPERTRRFVGVWISENKGWNGALRQYMMIVTNVDDDGFFIGHSAVGPPNARTLNKTPPGHYSFAGRITDEVLTMKTKEGVLRAKFTPEGHLQVVDHHDTGRESIVLLERAWSLVD